MALTRRIGSGVLLAVLILARDAASQTLTPEADVTVGASTDHAEAAAVQTRLFGQLTSDWRLMLEAAWADRSNKGSDAFGTSYSYDGQIRPAEMYVERISDGNNRVFAVRIGRYRTPFGMSSRSDHAYNGFSRAPLVRYGEGYAMSNLFMEAGADVIVGRPSLYLEASAGAPADANGVERRETADVVTRAQGYYRGLIIGASYLSGGRTVDEFPWKGRMMFRGIDARWMWEGVQVRGEWIDGRPFDDASTRGGYVDLFVHHIGMGPVTAIARIERLDYHDGYSVDRSRRATIGARVRLTTTLSLEADVLHNWGSEIGVRPTSGDLGITQSFRF
jgi:hypothetical protein